MEREAELLLRLKNETIKSMTHTIEEQREIIKAFARESAVKRLLSHVEGLSCALAVMSDQIRMMAEILRDLEEGK